MEDVLRWLMMVTIMVDPGKTRRNTHKRSFDYDVNDNANTGLITPPEGQNYLVGHFFKHPLKISNSEP